MFKRPEVWLVIKKYDNLSFNFDIFNINEICTYVKKTCIKKKTEKINLCLSVPVLMCPRVWMSLENGRVSSWPLGPPVEGTVLYYSCLPGFILMGRNASQCNKMGKWDTPKPVCYCKSLFYVYVAWLSVNKTKRK